MDDAAVIDEPLSTSELLEQWRDATRAAELAERLAQLARVSAERSDKDSVAAQEIAKIAERAAKHAERTARIAREAADRAMAYAQENRSANLAGAEAAATETRANESAARVRYHDAERAVHERQGDGLAAP
jgi:hypothetical protein